MELANGCVQFSLNDYVAFLKKVLRATETLRDLEESELDKWKNNIADRTFDLERILVHAETKRLKSQYDDMKSEHCVPLQKSRRFLDIFKKEQPPVVVVFPEWNDYLDEHLTADVRAKLVRDALTEHGDVHSALKDASYDYRQVLRDVAFDGINKNVQRMLDTAKSMDNTTIYLPLEQVTTLSNYISKRDEVNGGNNFFVIDVIISDKGNSCYW